MAVGREKADEALEVNELAKSATYEIDDREYVRKVHIYEETKESRLQGLKGQLALSDEPEAEELRMEDEALTSISWSPSANGAEKNRSPKTNSLMTSTSLRKAQAGSSITNIALATTRRVSV